MFGSAINFLRKKTDYWFFFVYYVVFMRERIIKEINSFFDLYSSFQAFVAAVLTCVFLSPILIGDIDGEIVYTAGFFIIFYVIWSELFVKSDDVLIPVLTYSNVASFWLKYKNVESDLISLFSSKAVLLNSLTSTFLLTVTVLKSLLFVKYNNYIYRISLQTLNRLKLKNKSLPLQ